MLECLGERVRVHGAKTEARGEHARGVDAEVLVQVGEDFVEEQVVLVVTAAPGHVVGVAVRCHEDGALLGALLVAVAVVMLVLRDVLGGTAHAVHAEHQAVGLVLVVVLGEVEVDFVLDAAARELEVVLERVVFAAALTWGGVVADGIAKGIGLLVGSCRELDLESRVERAERYGERVETFGNYTEGFALLHVLEQGTAAFAEGGAVVAGRGEADGLLRAAHGDLGKVGALGLYAGGEIHLARTVEALLEYLVTHQVKNPDVHGGISALREREDSGVDADVARSRIGKEPEGFRGITRRNRVSRGNFVFVDGELAVLVGCGRLVLFDEGDFGAGNSLVAIVLDGAADGICRCRSKSCCEHSGKNGCQPFHDVVLLSNSLYNRG